MKNSLCLVVILCLILSLGCKNTNEKTDTSTVTDSTESTSKRFAFLCTALPADADWYLTDSNSPMFDDLGDLHFPITTASEEAQKYFDQGLTLAYGFNHAEAARSFYTATRIDTSCAMCFWGYAYVLGPNYNAGMEPDHYQRAFDAISKAESLSENCTDKEKGLIEAMSARYTPEEPEDRSEFDLAYSEKLKQLTLQYPDDPDIAALYAESLMDMHPWDLYDKTGEEKPWTPEIMSALNNVLEIDPQHPGGHHFYIHAVEASSTPERGLKSAEIFDNGLVPGSGHLVHMPSHIYIRTGYYHKGTLANQRAVKVDSAYTTTCHAQGAYPLAYYPHNYHFMSATATLAGNSKVAIEAAKATSELAHPQLMKEQGWGTLQHYYSIPYFILVKFGKWQQVLNIPEETVELTYPRAVRHYARGMAFAASNDPEKARFELKQLKELSTDESISEITIWDINPASSILEIAIKVLEGEIAIAEKEYDKAVESFRDAVTIEDGLNYDEPPDWFLSVRHHLGEALIRAANPAEARKVFERDLEIFPENGWALHGLMISHRDLGNEEEMNSYNERYFKAWEHADIGLSVSKAL